MKRIKSIFSRLKNWVSNLTKSAVRDVKKRPLTNFYLALGLLVVLIILSNVLRPTSTTQQEEQEEKSVKVFSIGKVPTITAQAQIEKSGVIQINALTSGVVQSIHFVEGEAVAKGSVVISMSTNYQGGNTFSVQRQIAESQYKSAEETYQLQKEIIGKQKEIATASAENVADMRRITEQSLGDTRRLVELNEDMLEEVEDSISTLEQDPEENAELLASVRQQQLQLLSATTQARSALRNAEFQSSETNPPSELARFQLDLTMKQLQLQEKTLETTKEAARLQLQLARVTEALMFPAAPFSGTIQKIFVKEGTAVNPGAPLMIISQEDTGQDITAVAYVADDVAKKVSLLEPSVLLIADSEYQTYPSYVSTDAVQGTQYAVYYDIPNSFYADVTEAGFISVNIPIGYADTTATLIYIPIDAVYQSSESYVFVNEDNKAVSKVVTLGEVYGSYVEVLEGIEDGDQIILSRNVVAGDKITINN